MDKYTNEIDEMQKVSKEEYLASPRRCSSGFSRGVSKYRGVARHHHNGRWEARIARVFGNKHLYLGTYNKQVEAAAAANDMAALEHRGANAVTNFDISNYVEKLKQKGIDTVLDHLQEPVANSSSEYSEEAEVEQQQQQRDVQQEIASQQPKPQAVVTQDYPRMESSAMAPLMDLDELTWNFFMEPRFNPLPVLQFPLEMPGKFTGLFDESIRFEDNILDMIFDRNVDRVNPGFVVDNKGKGRLNSSPSSSTNSVSCNYFVPG